MAEVENGMVACMPDDVVESESEKWIGCVRLMMWMTCMCFK